MFRVTLSILSLVVLFIQGPTGAAAVGAVEEVHPAAAMQSTEDSPVSLWTDAAGDLWVSTLAYTWNITGGRSIVVRGSAGPSDWHAAADAGQSRLIDALFLEPDPGALLSASIFYALSDEAVVYVAQDGGRGEGLELAFRGQDGVIRVTHRTTVTSSVAAAPFAQRAPFAAAPDGAPAAQVLAGVLAADASAPAPDSFTYTGSFDPASGTGLTLVIPARQPAPGAPPDCNPAQPEAAAVTTPEGAALVSPSAFDPCRFPDFYLPGQVTGLEYLVAFSAEAAAPLAPLDLLAARLQLRVARSERRLHRAPAAP